MTYIKFTWQEQGLLLSNWFIKWCAGDPEVWDGSGDKSAYDAVMSRIYLNDPADSLLLRKATGEHHYGNVVIDRNTISGELDYNTILSWIIEGALEK